MADFDLLGILSLLLLAVGVAYLVVWFRRSRLVQEAVAPTAVDRGRDRAADTMPPTLRPHSEIPPKMAAKKEAMAKASGRPPAPELGTSARSAGKLPVSARSSETAKAAGASAAKSEVPAGDRPPKSDLVQRQPAPSSTTKAAAPPSASAKAAAPVAATASSAKMAVAKPVEQPVETKAAKPVEQPVETKAAKPVETKAAKPVEQPVETKAAKPVETKAAKPVEQPAVPAAEATSEPRASVPRLEVEEDEDVEPTRVGRAQRVAPIRPLVEKIVLDDGADAAAESANAQPLRIHAVAQTDTGKRRKKNEDSYLLLDKESLYIVADGMGGHRGGQVASKLAVTTMGDAFERKNFEAAAHEDIPIEASELARAVQMANTAIFTEAKKSRDLEGMGTTLVAARFTADKQRLYIAHVGDSRCYRVRNGVMRQMTSDHTMADYGVTGPEGAHLSRALGVWPTVPIDVIMASPEVGDLYLLCSDGLTKMISDGTIATQLLHEEDPKAAVGRLVFFANSHGGKDNITVVLLRIVPPGWKPPRTTLPPPTASEA